MLSHATHYQKRVINHLYRIDKERMTLNKTSSVENENRT